MTTSKRLEILKASLAKKQVILDAKFESHFGDVASANGQPLNDKRNGHQTQDRWSRQSNAIRNAQDSLERTEEAIDREEDIISRVAAQELPEFIRVMLASGELVQWRKHPNTFFVQGVDTGRIVWNEHNGTLAHRYVSSIPKEQYATFRDVFNKLNAAAKRSSPQSK